MTHFHYYATTSRALDRVLQYGVFPVSLLAGFAATHDIEKAKDVARVVSAAAYSALTTTFLGMESELVDANAREAVAAEMGVDPKKLTFSDFKYSQNAIISKAHNDVMRLQVPRYATDALFLLPIGVKFASKAAGKEWLYEIPGVNGKGSVGTNQLWDFGVLGAKAGYWAAETFFLDKTGNYEIVKLRENLQSTGKDLTTNDLLGVYQRTRHDRNLPMIQKAEEYDMLRPLLKKIADAYNRHDGTIGMPEIVYLIGMNKINIHMADNKTPCADLAAQSDKEIEKIMKVGLDGIREENRRKREAMGLATDYEHVAHKKSFVDRLGDRTVNTLQSIIGKVRKEPGHPEEYVSVRNPGDLANSNFRASR